VWDDLPLGTIGFLMLSNSKKLGPISVLRSLLLCNTGEQHYCSGSFSRCAAKVLVKSVSSNASLPTYAREWWACISPSPVRYGTLHPVKPQTSEYRPIHEGG
jgi:hypothetical protein